ncbi:MAG: 30S ribosomal protein S8e [Candidatus Thorarchaeota archaeon]|nr:30S ribosomal protein S8e [Candidatus Thorarchaeota archaeon]
MGVWHGRSRRTPSGALMRKFRGHRKSEMGRTPTETLIGEPRIRRIDSKGMKKKTPAMRLKYANVTDIKKKETYHVEILDVEKNPANMDYQRRKVITRGTIIKTSKGRAKVTSRPGQEGVLNAILL